MARLMCIFSFFWCGFYSSGTFIRERLIYIYIQRSEFANCVQETWHMHSLDGSSESPALWMLQICFKGEQTGMQKAFRKQIAVGFSPSYTTLGHQFQATALFKCILCATWVWRERGFNSSAVSVQVWLLFECSLYECGVYMYTQLYGMYKA